MAKHMNDSKQPKKMEIDERLYSRQLYTIGKDAMGRMIRSNVLICCAENFSGLGVEIAKCVVLAGVGKVSLYCKRDQTTYKDMASNYYLTDDLTDRSDLSDRSDPTDGSFDRVVRQIASLNGNVSLTKLQNLTSLNILKYDVVVFCDYNIHSLTYWNQICRENMVKMIVAQTYGLAGYMFCDFGDHHIVDDPDGEPLRTGRITRIENNKFYTTEPHHIYTGDVVMFNGMVDGLKTMDGDQGVRFLAKTIGSGFELHSIPQDGNNSSDHLAKHAFKSSVIPIPNQIPQNLVFNQVKLSQTVRSKSLKDQLKNPEFVMFDTNEWDMPKILHTFMKALSMWRVGRESMNRWQHTDCKSYQFLLKPEDRKDFQTLFELELKSTYKEIKFDTIRETFEKLFITCNGRICGVDAVIGSMTAQEVIKACTGRFTPNKQFLHFEALNILPDDYLEQYDKNPDNYLPKESRYDGQIVVFGRDYVDRLHDKKVFIVGAGAIGCEHVKNFSMMGVGNMTITDMDHIERSNLNRQFLFRNEDIGKSKSVTVAEKAKQMNRDVKITAQQNKVGKETTRIYSSKFFKNIDCVANALDNIEARLFVDSLCVRYNLPLLESGTLGTKGNVQSIVPDLTESYGSQQDPPEQHIPVCTLKLFPYKFEHTVQYATDLFSGYFNRIPANLIKVMENSDQLDQIDPTERQKICDDLMMVMSNCKNFKYAVNLAYKEWHRLFRDQINQLVGKYPKNHVDDEGNLFWSGDKIFPQAYEFDPLDETDLSFVIAFSNLWADMLGMPMSKRYPVDRPDRYIKFLQTLAVPSEVICRDIDQKTENGNIQDDQFIAKIKQMVVMNRDLIKNAKVQEFEKDDDLNNHVNFITAVANKRAGNYRLECRDRMAVKGIAGKIIPAIATTTSLVSGLVSLEMYKIFFGQMDAKYNRVTRYRYGSFNLAVQSFGLGEPKPVSYTLINGKDYSIWSKDTIDSRQTIGDLIKKYDGSYLVRHNKSDQTDDLSKIPLGLEFIAGDGGLVYTNMTTGFGDDQSDPVTKKTISDVIRDLNPAEEDEMIETDYFLTISLEEEDETDDVDRMDRTRSDLMITCRVDMSR